MNHHTTVVREWLDWIPVTKCLPGPTDVMPEEGWLVCDEYAEGQTQLVFAELDGDGEWYEPGCRGCGCMLRNVTHWARVRGPTKKEQE